MRLGGKPHYRTTRPTLSFIDTRVMLEVMSGLRGVGGVVAWGPWGLVGSVGGGVVLVWVAWFGQPGAGGVTWECAQPAQHWCGAPNRSV